MSQTAQAADKLALPTGHRCIGVQGQGSAMLDTPAQEDRSSEGADAVRGLTEGPSRG